MESYEGRRSGGQQNGVGSGEPPFGSAKLVAESVTALELRDEQVCHGVRGTNRVFSTLTNVSVESSEQSSNFVQLDRCETVNGPRGQVSSLKDK